MANKSGMGRPPKRPSLRKTHRVQLLLTPTEHQRLVRYARKQDLTVSELLRLHVRSLLERKET